MDAKQVDAQRLGAHRVDGGCKGCIYRVDAQRGGTGYRHKVDTQVGHLLKFDFIGFYVPTVKLK